MSRNTVYINIHSINTYTPTIHPAHMRHVSPSKVAHVANIIHAAETSTAHT